MTEHSYSGQCHCGALGFRYTTALAPARWSVRACQCRFCLAHAALSASDPIGSLEFLAPDFVKLQRYRFALKTADFLLCRRCGIYIGAVIESAAGRFGIVNTRSLSPPLPDLADARLADYDREDTAARIARREARWTPVTAVPWPDGR